MLQKLKSKLSYLREHYLKNIPAYIQGNLRYKLYYSNSPLISWLMRDFIREQIEFRIKFMDRLCWSQGSCKLCGCQTTHLQMANKACDKPCYPRMMSAKQWKLFKVGSYLYLDGNKLWEYFPEPDPHLTTLGKGFEEELVFYMRPEKYKRTFFTHTQKPINHVEP